MSETNKTTKIAKALQQEPVFRLKPIRTDPTELSKCDVKHVGYISNNQNLGDEIVELETTLAEQRKYGKNIHTLGEINGYDITVRIYRNNMTGHYMINSKQLPICNLQLMYSKTILTGYLFNVFIYFILDPYKNSFLKDPKSYVGATIYGVFYMILDSEGEINQNISHLYNNLCEKYAKEQLLEEMNNTNMTEDELVKRLYDIIEEKKEFYKKIMVGTEIKSYRNIKEFIDDYLKPIYNNRHFIDIIKYALEERHKKRIKEYKAYDKEYKIPEKILKLSDYENNPELIDKYLDIENDNYDSE
jgi:flagellar biosynthesis chaperone FliJ